MPIDRILFYSTGEILGSVDSLLMNNSYGAVSNCGRFFGCCGFTSDVKVNINYWKFNFFIINKYHAKVWEACFDKTGNFKEIKKAFDLKGHSAGVYHFAYNSDSSRWNIVAIGQIIR